jgi:hypothetical protein
MSLKIKTRSLKYWTMGFSLGLALITSSFAQAQDEELPSDTSSLPSTSAPGAAANGTQAGADGELPPPVAPKAKEFSVSEKLKQCKKYEGKYISYYEHIYRVEKCKRREYLVDEGVEPKTKGLKIISVESDTVAMIPAGEPLNPSVKKKNLTCAQLNNQYVISRGDEIFFIEKCKKRLFPDLDTYTDHSKKRGKREQDILELDEMQIAKIEDGTPITSSLDAEYKKLLDADTGIDVLPLAEACKGLNGKFVAYYSKLYRIEKCRKQPVDPEVFGRRYPKYSPQELTSEQWISIPTGQNLKL